MADGILIAGAGIGGLTTALALLQRGFDVTVYEQAHELRETGAGVQISPNGTRVLASLGLLDQILAVAVVPIGKEIRLWSTGETWPLFDLGPRSLGEYGFPYLMIHRGDLHTVLADAVRRAKPDAIRTGTGVAEAVNGESDAAIVLDSGERIAGRLVIGADGIHSNVRAGILGPARASFTGCAAWRGVVPSDRLPPHLRRGVGTNWVGPGRHVVTYPLRRGELVNFVGVVEREGWQEESWTAQGTRAECAADFPGWHDDVQTLIDSIDVHYRWALIGREPIERWSDGRIVLVGDACHSMLPFMAQGAVMAIEDGVVLARCLACHPDDVAAAIAAYEAMRIVRANRCVRAADRNRELFHSGRLLDCEDAQAYVTTQWSEDKVRERYDWLFSYDALGCAVDSAAGVAA